jgi:hypothetical protein
MAYCSKLVPARIGLVCTPFLAVWLHRPGGGVEGDGFDWMRSENGTYRANASRLRRR